MLQNQPYVVTFFYVKVIDRLCTLSIFTLLICHPLFAQELNIGIPPISNFPKNTYIGGTQNWDIVQDKRGVMYFGNNDGMLEFDGNNWRMYPLGNGTIVRSLQIAKDGRIYAGGQGDFGYFQPDGNGILHYHSLRNLVPASNRNFEDVWDIVIRDDEIFFRTNNQLFQLSGGACSVLSEGTPLHFMDAVQETLFIQHQNADLFIFEKNEFRNISNKEVMGDALISGLLNYHPDTLLLTTLKDGIFFYSNGKFGPWNTSDDPFLRQNRIYCARLLPENKVALGTSLNGLVILDPKRRIFHHLNKEDGLQNNTVLSIFTDRSGNLWLGLDNGIDFVHINSAFYSIFPDRNLEGTGYAVHIHDGNIYFATNSGIYFTAWKTYYSPEEKKNFFLVNNSDGQAWSLNRLGDALVAGLHEGAFIIENGTARRLADFPGVWKFIQLSDRKAVAGHYNGLAIFEKQNGKWVYLSQPENFTESSRVMVRDSLYSLWMAHPYRGIYRLRISEPGNTLEVQSFDVNDGLPSNLNNYVFRVGNQTLFAGETGLFTFDESKRIFVPEPDFTAIFGTDLRVKYLRQDAFKNIWYVAGNETGVLLVEENPVEKKVTRLPIPELAGKLVGGFEFILPVDKRNVFFATDKGFVHFDMAKYYSRKDPIQMVLREVRLDEGSDSLLFGGHFPAHRKLNMPILSHQQNALRFVFSAIDYGETEYLQYAHFLEGADREWSDWNTESVLSFNNLGPGNYTFHVKARNAYGTESPVISYSFEITPPWYASPLALAFYSLLILGLVAGIIVAQRTRFENEKRQMQSTHQQREEAHQMMARQSEEAINRLKNEKLEAEVQHKNQELATATMHLVQKSEILNSIKEALEKVEKKAGHTPAVKKEIGRIIKMVEKDASLDEDWEQFSRNFDKVHSDFLKRLSHTYSNLSPNDYKLCAYLRMNLSSKEIASLMNISVRGVEASRYRLRKKLNLDTNTNLTEFIMKL